MDSETEKRLHRLADASGAAIMPFFRAGYSTSDKGNPGWFDPVTEADHAAERAIRDLLRAECPRDGIVGEEFGVHDGTSGRRWIVDPIDGTRSFLAGVPLFGTIIGLAEGDRAIAGLFDQPFTAERFFGDGGNSFWTHGGRRAALRTRDTASLADALLMTTSPKLFKGAEAETYERVESAVRLARYGADGYAYALLAAGQIDVIVENGLQTYDIAGLIPVIEGAGGIVTTWEGGNALSGGRILAAANPAIHEAAMRLLEA